MKQWQGITAYLHGIFFGKISSAKLCGMCNSFELSETDWGFYKTEVSGF